jgi:hypothetical protein
VRDPLIPKPANVEDLPMHVAAIIDVNSTSSAATAMKPSKLRALSAPKAASAKELSSTFSWDIAH